jgi:hypothetical protein
MAVTAIGWRAHAALVASGGRAEVVAQHSTSCYANAAGELIWIGPAGAPLHPRSVMTSDPVGASADGAVHLVVDGVTPWRPPALREPSAGIRDAVRALHARVAELGEPRGLGRLLVPSAGDDLVAARARPHARALASACAADDAAAVAEAARPLLGLGAGLTPSGDDYVGGALFARRLVAGRDTAAWDAAVARIVTDTATLTHPISARLLADLAGGEGWAPLHDLAAALAAGDLASALGAARRLTALGHTSGWDMLAGFSAGLGSLPNA